MVGPKTLMARKLRIAVVGALSVTMVFVAILGIAYYAARQVRPFYEQALRDRAPSWNATAGSWKAGPPLCTATRNSLANGGRSSPSNKSTVGSPRKRPPIKTANYWPTSATRGSPLHVTA